MRITACFLLFLPLIVQPGCCRTEVSIGLVTSLSGRYSDMAVNCRNGAVLAVEDLQKKSGKYSFRLVTMDDEGDPARSQKCIKELAAQGVSFVVGPLVTGTATWAVPEINAQGMLTVGPVIAGENLAGKDDFFIKLFPSTEQLAARLSSYAVKKAGVTSLAAIYDVGNREYSELWYANLKKFIEQEGGRVSAPVVYKAGDAVRYDRIAETALEKKTQGVFVCASGFDSALLCQQLKKRGAVPVFLSSWASTNELITAGGRSVEGVILCQPYDWESDSASYRSFSDRYSGRFSRIPNYGAMFHYEAVMLLADAIAKAGPDPGKAKKEIISKGYFDGLQGRVNVDRNGDVTRPLYIYTVEKNRFRKVE